MTTAASAPLSRQRQVCDSREPAPRSRRPRVCTQLLPRMDRASDEWGYPIVNDPELPPELIEGARRAANHCPVLALWLDPESA